MPTARWSDIWPRARGSCECFLLRGSRLSFEWSTNCAANTRQSSGGEQLLFLLAPRQEGREVWAETRVSSVVLPAGNSARLRAQLQLGRLGEGCCGPGLPVPAAGRNLGQFSRFFFMAYKSNWGSGTLYQLPGVGAISLQCWLSVLLCLFN